MSQSGGFCISVKANARRKETLQKAISFLKKHHRNIPHKEFPLPFYEVLGAFIGDGNLSACQRHYTLMFTGDSRTEIPYYNQAIIPAIQYVFPQARPRIHYRSDCNAIQVKFHSKHIVNTFSQWFGMEPGSKTETIRIPEYILNESLEVQYRVIRGIFDTDGTVYIDNRKMYARPYPRIALQTKSPFLFHQLVYILSKEFRIRTQYIKTREIHEIELYGRKQLKLWMKTIGFSNPRHLTKIRALLAQPVERVIGTTK